MPLDPNAYSRHHATVKVAQKLMDWNEMSIPEAAEAAITAVQALELEGYISFDMTDDTGTKPDRLRHELRHP